MKLEDDGLGKLPGLKRLPKFGKLKMKRSIRGPGSMRRVGEILDLVPEEEKNLIRRLGGDSEARRLAKRIIKYKGVYPTASYPELITYDWLDENGVRFIFQAHLFGGRSLRGGLVPDFLIQRGGFLTVWQIQGVYWHSQFGSRQRDDNAKLRYLGQEFNGNRINSVLNIWEDDIYEKRPQVFLWAMSGLELIR